MTREEAIKNIKEQMDLYVWQLEDINKVVEPRRYEQYRLAIMSFEMAIKALEQEPQTDEIILSKKEYRELLSDEFEHGYDKGLSDAITNGTPLTPKVLADLLMEERIRGELKQDVSYSKDVIDDVRCRLTVDIIDRRPCYCGAELGAVWRERKESTVIIEADKE